MHLRFHRWAGIIHSSHVPLDCVWMCVVFRVCACGVSLCSSAGTPWILLIPQQWPLLLRVILQSVAYCFEPPVNSGLRGIRPCVRGSAGLWEVLVTGPWMKHTVQGLDWCNYSLMKGRVLRLCFDRPALYPRNYVHIGRLRTSRFLSTPIVQCLCMR